MNKEELIEVYKDVKILAEWVIDKPIHRLCNLTTFKIDNNFKKKTKITVEPLDTISALIKYEKLGKTAILNMASQTKKGGGVENGAMAQEECLFRCSNLCDIPDILYPLKIDEFIYSKNITVFNDVNYTRIRTIKCDVITMPAINLNTKMSSFNRVKNYEGLMVTKIFNIFNTALMNKSYNIILGAWGCGVFNNDPHVIAKMFKYVLKTYFNNKFDNVVFAVINDKNSVGNNYNIFKDTF